jgi:hypothetical protein
MVLRVIVLSRSEQGTHNITTLIEDTLDTRILLERVLQVLPWYGFQFSSNMHIDIRLNPTSAPIQGTLDASVMGGQVFAIITDPTRPARMYGYTLERSETVSHHTSMLGSPEALQEIQHVPSSHRGQVDQRQLMFDVHSSEETFFYALCSERRNRPNPNYIREVQTQISPIMRATLIDWLNDVCTEFRLQTQSLYLAVNIVDRVLSKVMISRNKLQALGAVAMFISSKYYELNPPTIDEFVLVTDNTYSKCDLLQLEVLVLNTLGFNITVVTSFDLLDIILQTVNATEECENLAHYLTELCLQDYRMIRFLPSVVSLSAVVVSLHALQQRCWPESLRRLSGYRTADLVECIHEIMRVQRDAQTSHLIAVKTKYSHEYNRQVALLTIPLNTPNMI